MENMIICAASGTDVTGVPDEIRILPLGMVHSQKGDFTVDDESFELIREHFKERRLDIVIDYEHQTLKDVQAPAGGWIKDLYKTEDAVCAKVEWTPKAQEYLKNKEYRYLSPVVMVRKKDRKAAAIHSVALTNTPAIDGMFAIVNALNINDNFTGGTSMELQEIARLLGLPETATEEDVRKALKEKDDEGGGGTEAAALKQAADPTVLALLGLKEDATVAQVAASIMGLKAGGSTDKELSDLKEQLKKRNADDAVGAALKAGKITAAQKEWATAYALKDPEGFRSFTEQAPAVVPMEKVDLKDAPASEELTDDNLMKILKDCGLTKEDYEKYYKED